MVCVHSLLFCASLLSLTSSSACPLNLSSQAHDTVSKLIRYSIAMLIFPIFIFYVVQSLAEGHPQRTMLSGLCAVLTANGVIAAYVLMAFRETAGGNAPPSAASGTQKKGN